MADYQKMYSLLCRVVDSVIENINMCKYFP